MSHVTFLDHKGFCRFPVSWHFPPVAAPNINSDFMGPVFKILDVSLETERSVPGNLAGISIWEKHSSHFPGDFRPPAQRGNSFQVFEIFWDFEPKNISFSLCVTVHKPPFAFKGDKDDSNNLQIEWKRRNWTIFYDAILKEILNNIKTSLLTGVGQSCFWGSFSWFVGVVDCWSKH